LIWNERFSPPPKDFPLPWWEGIKGRVEPQGFVNGFRRPQIHRLIPGSLEESVGLGTFLITSKASDARRQGTTTEAYGAIRRKEERSQATPQMMS